MKNLINIVLLFSLPLLIYPGTSLLAAEPVQETPFVIHQIMGNPSRVTSVFAITSNFGVLKSEDSGLTWTTASRGITSFTHHAIANSPAKTPRIYLGAWGGGVYKSEDEGATWKEMNNNLGNTAVDAMVVDPGTPDQIFIATSTRFFKSTGDGKEWTPFGEGLPPFPDEIKFKSLILAPGLPKTLWLGDSQGLFYRKTDADRWEKEEKLKNIGVSALAYDEKNRRLWVGSLNQGLYQKRDQEKKWKRVKIEDKLWINQIVLDPTNPQIIYLGTRGKGIYKTKDGGNTWSPSNRGLEDKDIRSLAVHPLNSALLFSGTTSKGIFRSTDGGNQWEPAQHLPSLTMEKIIEMVSVDSTSPATPPVIPKSFSKCNGCHGWTDPLLNQKKTYWRVPPNQRDWKETVGRMSIRSRLTAVEENEITKFLSEYGRQKGGGATSRP